MSCNLDGYSDILYGQKNTVIDWYFPVIDLCEDSQWLLFENNFPLNELDICNIFKNKLLCEFQTEIFLQHPLIIQVIIKF